MYIGVDTHKRTHTLAEIDTHGRPGGARTITRMCAFAQFANAFLDSKRGKPSRHGQTPVCDNRYVRSGRRSSGWYNQVRTDSRPPSALMGR